MVYQVYREKRGIPDRELLAEYIKEKNAINFKNKFEKLMGFNSGDVYIEDNI